MDTDTHTLSHAFRLFSVDLKGEQQSLKGEFRLFEVGLFEVFRVFPTVDGGQHGSRLEKQIECTAVDRVSIKLDLRLLNKGPEYSIFSLLHFAVNQAFLTI